jgi:hypothetical protein
LAVQLHFQWVKLFFHFWWQHARQLLNQSSGSTRSPVNVINLLAPMMQQATYSLCVQKKQQLLEDEWTIRVTSKQLKQSKNRGKRNIFVWYLVARMRVRGGGRGHIHVIQSRLPHQCRWDTNFFDDGYDTRPRSRYASCCSGHGTVCLALETPPIKF